MSTFNTSLKPRIAAVGLALSVTFAMLPAIDTLAQFDRSSDMAAAQPASAPRV